MCYNPFITEPVTKKRILKAVEELPDDVTLNEAIEIVNEGTNRTFSTAHN